jgi:molecular chaperone Hsp33
VTRKAEGTGSVTTDWAAKAARISAATAPESVATMGRNAYVSAGIWPTVARATACAYVGAMSETPAFLDGERPPVPDIVVPRGVTSFHLPRRPVRGRLVRLGPLAHALLTRHPNHPAVTRLAGQSLALAAALSTALKFRGSFSVQAKGDGAVPMLLADCTDTGALRGYARSDPKKLEELLRKDPSPAADRLLGGGYLAFTVDQGPDQNRHQGIVTIEGGNLAEMALHYFSTSEQLRCFVHLACDETADGWRAGALVLEKIAGAGGIDPSLDDDAQEESWRTATILAATLTDAELLDDALLPERLLYRLFHTEGVATDRSRALSYGCRCSRARLVGILEGFPPDDLDHMAVDGDIVMTCEFCNYDFRFPRQDVRGRGAPAC